MDWQPIDTAPKDGTIIIAQNDHLLVMAVLYQPKYCNAGAWFRDNGGGCFTVYCKPERWIPMPTSSSIPE